MEVDWVEGVEAYLRKCPAVPKTEQYHLQGWENVYLEDSNIGIKLKGTRKGLRVYQPRGELLKVQGPSMPLKEIEVSACQFRTKQLKEVNNHACGHQGRKVKANQPLGKQRKKVKANQLQDEMQKEVVVIKLRGLRLKEFRANFYITRTLYKIWLHGDPKDMKYAMSIYTSLLKEAKVDKDTVQAYVCGREKDNAFYAYLSDEELKRVLDLEGVKSSETVMNDIVFW